MSEDLEKLKDLLNSMDPKHLSEIGVRLERPDPQRWGWLRDIMIDCLESLGRTKAASNLRDYPFSGVQTFYSMGITADLLSQMANRIEARFNEAKP